MRKIIYYGANSKRAVVSISLEERKKLKNEMIMELGKMLGGGVVENVYFTKYIIM